MRRQSAGVASKNRRMFSRLTTLRCASEPKHTARAFLAISSTSGPSYGNLAIGLVTGNDFSVQTIFEHHTIGSTYTVRLGGFKFVNNTYMLFIGYGRSGGTYGTNTYYKVMMMHSDTCAPNSWIEETLIPEEYVARVYDNESNRITIYEQGSISVTNEACRSTLNSSVIHALYYNDTYYIYMSETHPYNHWVNYYKRGTTKVITGYGSDTEYHRVIVFTSNDLMSWEKHYLPQYLDVPFFNNNDLFTGRCGYGAKSCRFNAVRFFIDAKSMMNTLPSGTISSQMQYQVTTMVANPFGGVNPYLTDEYNVITTDIINGEIKQYGEINNDDGIWMYRNVIYTEGTGSLMEYRQLTCFVHISDPLFNVDPDNYVYLLRNNRIDSGDIPDINENVDPISTEDYIFD